jgi:hypothetical protein
MSAASLKVIGEAVVLYRIATWALSGLTLGFGATAVQKVERPEEL